MINNRQQAGRRRGRGGQRPQGGGNPGRPESGNRIDNRARGNAAQLHEKYKTLARDSQMQGDRVNTEYYLQFADHYFRVLSESRARADEQQGQNQQQQRRPQQDAFDDGYEADDEYGDEGEPVRADQYQTRPPEPRRETRGDERAYETRNDDRGQGRSERTEGRNDESREARGNGRDDRGNRGEDRNSRGGNARADGGYNGQSRDAANGPPPRQPANGNVAEAAPSTESGGEDRSAEPAAPRRRGRPPRNVDAAAAAEPAAFDANLLPPSLSVPATAEATGDDVEAEGAKPRRRRGRPPASEVVQAS